jgi:hypothetical protein
MTRWKRVVVIGYLTTLALAFCWVPWKAWDTNRQAAIRLPHGFIWSGPRLPDWMTYEQRFRNHAQVDVSRVALEVFALSAVFGAAFAMTPAKSRK